MPQLSNYNDLECPTLQTGALKSNGKTPVRPTRNAPSRSTEELIFYMRIIAGGRGCKWETNFARSVLRQSRKPGWDPSPKKRSLMERMVSELITYGDDNGDVIET